VLPLPTPGLARRLATANTLSLPLIAALAVSLVVLGACSADPPPRNGVNDVKAACELRAKWTRPTTERCVACVAAAPIQGCDCEDYRDFAGFCQDQGNARRAEGTCTEALDDCVRACKTSDCPCIEACYGNAATCKTLSAARDGCVVDVCSQYCN